MPGTTSISNTNTQTPGFKYAYPVVSNDNDKQGSTNEETSSAGLDDLMAKLKNL
jgi:hypothetical protein